MRGISFRGREPGCKEWMRGGYCLHMSRTPYCAGDRIRKKDLEHLIICKGYSDWGMPCGVDYYAVDPETVGQWIGILDVNKIKVYENDIVKDEQGNIFRIVWRDFGFKAENQDQTIDLASDMKLTVIGNIHDNPELLEGGEE